MNFKVLKKNKRLEFFDFKLSQRKIEIKEERYTPDCKKCLDLDYYIDYFSDEPTLCMPCVIRNMDILQAKIKGILSHEEIL